MPTISEIKSKWPLHYLVWENDYVELERVLKENKVSARMKNEKKKIFFLEH
jgi:hypothetical protein